MNYIKHHDTKTKHYMDCNVYEAAKKRVVDAIKKSDNQAVLFSGGKDSTVTAYLVKEVYNTLGIDKPVNLIFMDEELIGKEVLTYIQRFKDSKDFELYYFKIPLLCEKYNTGDSIEYTQNDPQRDKSITPDYAITNEKLGMTPDKVLTRYELADIQAGLFTGKVCLFKGIRTEESLYRMTQVLRRPTHPHTGKETSKHFECIPIYDWTAKDVFLYFYKNKIPYNPMYNGQMYKQAPLRLSTPIHPYNTDTFNNLRSIDPDLYQYIVDVFPDMAHADRYTTSKLKDNSKSFKEYPHTLDGLIQYIDHCYTDPAENITVKKRVLWAYKRGQENKNKPTSDVFGGYPLYHLFKTVQRGAAMRNIMPRDKPGLDCYTFEGYTLQDYVADKNKRGGYTCYNQ